MRQGGVLIRRASEQDIPRILDLLRVTLGERSIRRSESWWRWKHVENPFGPSPVLVAEKGGELVGVRAFMRWSWRRGHETFSAVRAVDTATHPAWRGAGIFRTLTLQLVEECKQEKIDFVFNTPNAQSGPGYLKMGWSSLGRLPVACRPMWRRGHGLPAALRLDGLLSDPSLDHLLTHWTSSRTTLVTAVARDYLRWRYAANAAVAGQYDAVADLDRPAPYVVIVRIKRLFRRLAEMRVVDFFAAPGFNPAECRSRVAAYARSRDVDVMTWSSLMPQGWPFRGVGGRIGPVVTVRALSRLPIAGTHAFTGWTPSLGDMELF